MSTGGTVYTKTIDASAQGGSDKNLIINPNFAYLKKFSFGDDWTEIKLGMFLSYTNSATEDNESFTGGSVSSGSTTPDTYNWMGFIKDVSPKVIPPDGDFIGLKFNALRDINSVTSSFTNRNTLSNDGFSTTFVTTSVTEIGASLFTNSGLTYVPFTKASDTTEFAAYLGLSVVVNNKGLSNQTVTIRKFRESASSGIENNSLTDVSLTNLKILTNATTTSINNTLDYSKDGVAIPLPDSFFFYNAFLTCRPRIHAIAVKKIS